MTRGTDETIATAAPPATAGSGGGLAIGDVLGDRFTIEQPLGSGGMGVVYRARDRVLDRPVAVKVLRPEYRSHEELIVRFLNEAKIVASLFTNPNIVNIYDLGRTERGDPYLVMELLRGRCLREVIDPSESMLPSRTFVLEIASQIASALVDAHKSGVAHRDLKPENVFILDTHTSIVKVLDFGLAVSSNAPLAEPYRTRPGEVLGTPVYMSPEAVRGEAVGAAADIYALGIMVHELATNGSLPYDAKTLGQWMRAHELDVPKPFPALKYPPQLAALVARMLAKDPDARPRAWDVYRELVTIDKTIDLSTQR